MRKYLPIGQRLKSERERLGLNQSDFAKIVGTGRKTVFNYESGERVPDASYLSMWFEIGVDVTYVITGIPTTIGQLKQEGKLKASDGFINAMGKFTEVDDGDTSRDNEIFTTKTTQALNSDEIELVQLFRAASLQKKMLVVQLLSDSNDSKQSSTDKSINIKGNNNKAAGRDYNENK